jgi:DNA-directed RNA polymerase specialized sigma24 family protein
MTGRAEHRDDAARVAAVAFDLVDRMSVPAEHRLSSDAVEDIRMEAACAVWAAAARDAHAFRTAEGRISAPAVAVYLRLALRRSLDVLARQERERLAALEALTQDAESPAAEEAFLAAEDERLLGSVLAALAESSRAVVERRRGGWSYARIAASLGVRRNTAIQRYRRALARVPADLRPLLPPSHARGF